MCGRVRFKLDCLGMSRVDGRVLHPDGRNNICFGYDREPLVVQRDVGGVLQHENPSRGANGGGVVAHGMDRQTNTSLGEAVGATTSGGGNVKVCVTYAGPPPSS